MFLPTNGKQYVKYTFKIRVFLNISKFSLLLHMFKTINNKDFLGPFKLLSVFIVYSPTAEDQKNNF